MPEMLQRTLSGGEQLLCDIEEIRGGKPDTFLYCGQCDDWILRSRRFDHDHELVTQADLEALADDEDEPEQVGSMWDITLEYSVTYRFRVPAYNEHTAKERAKDLKLDARPADAHHLHTETREVTEIMSDNPKVPDDYDPYGGTLLWEVYGKDDE